MGQFSREADQLSSLLLGSSMTGPDELCKRRWRQVGPGEGEKGEKWIMYH